ncbi:twin-arginine translocase TatA/TatE family subunit [Aeoliella sp.]|uniref:twin-arginine translocase TatA/TatE family subunit n=1 Tax=Aeoliella sp. TaxID=2795800 RepID=UPI003CCBBD3E
MFPGHWQILIVLLVVLLLFGNRLPQLARSMGMSLTEFKKGIKEIDEKPADDSKDPTP